MFTDGVPNPINLTAWTGISPLQPVWDYMIPIPVQAAWIYSDLWARVYETNSVVAFTQASNGVRLRIGGKRP